MLVRAGADLGEVVEQMLDVVVRQEMQGYWFFEFTDAAERLPFGVRNVSEHMC